MAATPAPRALAPRRVVPQIADRSRVALPAALAILQAATPAPAPVARLALRVGRVVPVRARVVAAPRVVRVAWPTPVRAARWPRVLVVTVARPTPAAPRAVMAPRVPAAQAATPVAPR